MPLPFPGMNPYLENASVWHDFHQSLVTRIRDALAEQVRPKFSATIAKFRFCHEIATIGREDLSSISTSSALIARIPNVDVEYHSYIEIRDRVSRELVTMIEVLSPSNKHYGPDREQYLMKRTALLCSRASIVEIDLLRAGPRLPLSGVPECDYLFMVSRSDTRPDVQVWPIKLRDPLPALPIPLRGSVPDAVLELQPLLHDVYDSAGYEDYLYEKSPEPPLDDADLTWAQQMIS